MEFFNIKLYDVGIGSLALILVSITAVGCARFIVWFLYLHSYRQCPSANVAQFVAHFVGPGCNGGTKRLL